MSGTYCHPIVSLTKSGVSKYVFSLLAQCGLFSLLTNYELCRLKGCLLKLHETWWEKVLYMHQKYYSLLFYIFTSLRLLLFPLLFFQISCKVELSSLFEMTNGCHRTFPSREGQVPQCVLQATTANSFTVVLLAAFC